MPSQAASANTRDDFDEFFGRALEAYQRAEAIARKRVQRRFQIAGIEIEFRSTTPALASVFCGALEHNEIERLGEPDVTFHIWDEASCGIGLPPARWNRRELRGHGEITPLIDQDRYLQILFDRALVGAAYRPAKSVVVWLRSLVQAAGFEQAAPLATLINWWTSPHGYFNVHAGAVGRSDGGILIIGKAGAGKSHAAIACLDSDLFFAADDHCLLGTAGRPVCASLYSTAKLFLSDLHRFPLLHCRQGEAIRTDEGKGIFYLKQIAPHRLSTGFPIRAVVLPQHSGRRNTTITPSSAAAAFLLLGPYSALRSPSVGRTAFASFACTLRSIPCFRLETGTDISQIPKRIATLLDNLN